MRIGVGIWAILTALFVGSCVDPARSVERPMEPPAPSAGDHQGGTGGRIAGGAGGLDTGWPPNSFSIPELPSRLTFTPVPVGKDSNAYVRIENHSADALPVTVATVAPFRILEPPARQFTIPPHDSYGLYVKFEPQLLGTQTRPLLLIFPSGRAVVALDGLGIQICESECLENDPSSGRCRPVAEGLPCGDAHACSDGSFCRAGACTEEFWPGGSACNTPCGGPGSCQKQACMPPWGELRPTVRSLHELALPSSMHGRVHRGIGFTIGEQMPGRRELLSWKDGRLLWSVPSENAYVRQGAGPAIWYRTGRGGELRAVTDGRLLWTGSAAHFLDAREDEVLVEEAGELLRIDTQSGEILRRWSVEALDSRLVKRWWLLGRYSGDSIYLAGSWTLPSDWDEPPARTVAMRLELEADTPTFRMEWDGRVALLIDDGLGGAVLTTREFGYMGGVSRALSADGSIRFEREAPYVSGFWSLDATLWRLDDRLLQAAGAVLDARTGAELYALPEELRSWPIASGGLVHVQGRDTIYGFDPRDGSPRYERPNDSMVLNLHPTDAGTVSFGASDGHGWHICEIDSQGELVRDARLGGHPWHSGMLAGSVWMAVEHNADGPLDRVLVWHLDGFSTQAEPTGSFSRSW